MVRNNFLQELYSVQKCLMLRYLLNFSWELQKISSIRESLFDNPMVFLHVSLSLSGLLTATVSSEVFKAAQPALLYLVPFTLLPLLTMAYLKVILPFPAWLPIEQGFYSIAPKLCTNYWNLTTSCMGTTIARVLQQCTKIMWKLFEFYYLYGCL